MTDTAEREAFETWAAPILGDNPTWRESAPCELAWQAFQAGRAAHPVAQADHSEMAQAVAAADGTLHGAVDHWQARAMEAEAKLAMLKPISAHWQARAQTAEAKLAAQAWNDAPETDAARLNFALEALVAAGHVSALRVHQALALYPVAAATGAAQPATQTPAEGSK